MRFSTNGTATESRITASHRMQSFPTKTLWLAAVIVGFLTPLLTHAEPTLDLKEFAASIGIVPGTKRYQAVFGEEAEPRDTAQRRAMLREGIEEESYRVRPVIIHYKAKGGIPFPVTKTRTKEAIELLHKRAEAGDLPHDPSPEMRAIKDRYARDLKAHHPALNIPRLSACTESGKQKTKVDLTPKFPEGFTVRDTLFIDAKQLEDPEIQKLSANLQILPYEEKRENPAARMAAIFKVTCLPYRVRITPRAVYRYHGAAALKDYEQRSKK